MLLLLPISLKKILQISVSIKRHSVPFKTMGDHGFFLYLARLAARVCIGVRAGGAGGAAAPPVSKIFGQNAKNSGNKETINDGIEK